MKRNQNLSKVNLPKSSVVSVSLTGIFSKLISLITWSKWNHTAFLIDGWVYERDLKSIKSTPIQEYLKFATIHIHYRSVPELDKIWVDDYILNVSILKKYDWLRTLLWPFRLIYKDRNRDSENCVEFIESVYFNKFGYNIFNKSNLSPAQVFEHLSSFEKTYP